MKYILVENREIIHLGPIDWKPRFIKSELEDLEIDFFIPPVEEGYIKINDKFEIIPITSGDVIPIFDPIYEGISGPFYTYSEFEVGIFYEVQQQQLESIKCNLKPSIVSERYNKEISGTKVTLQGVEVTLDTSRGNRDIFYQKYLLMGDSETIQWKFPETWLTLTKAEFGEVASAIIVHVQNAFDWELSIFNKVDSANDIEMLKSIEIIEPSQVTNEFGMI